VGDFKYLTFTQNYFRSQQRRNWKESMWQWQFLNKKHKFVARVSILIE